MSYNLLRFAGALAGMLVLSPVTHAVAQAESASNGAARVVELASTSADAAPAGNLDISRSDTASSSVATVSSPLTATLPDAPSAVTDAPLPASFVLDSNPATPNVAPRLTKYIPAGVTAQRINGRDKFLLGVRDLYSPLNFIAMIASAGYEQVLNSEPNYGTDRGAFGERLGAAAIRESTQGFFTDSVFAPIFHEDPRYYVQGKGHSFIHRVVYAATRPLITKTDNGTSTINTALLVGYAGSAALSYTYYPQINKNFHDTASTYGGSIGGAALGYVVSEFSADVLGIFHKH